MVRKDWLNLNGTWELAFAKIGEAAPLGKTLPERILVPFPVESALSGVAKRAERLWYRRTFQVPADWKGQRIRLHFGAVDWEATAYLNGKKLGEHRGGFDPFSFDITDELTPNGPQELIVGVFDPSDGGNQPRGKQVRKPEGIYYTPSTGIWQTVWLEPVSNIHLESIRLVPDIDNQTLRAAAKVSNEPGVTVEWTAYAEGMQIARGTGPANQAVELKIPNPKLWSPETPYLYDLKVRCVKNGKIVDAVDSYFGMRKISLGKDEQGIQRILLNNQFVFQMGPLDQGFWPDGLFTAPTDDALRFDIEETKKLGFNMTRKHVKVEPARWYYWCDKLGLLVWQDMPSGNNRSPDSKKQFEIELARMIDHLENHPSIILWVVFNEGWGQYDTERLTQWVKDRDPSRLVNDASGWTDKKVGDVIDRHVYPGPGAAPAEEKRASVLGEFGGLSLGVDGHTWTAKFWGYQGTSSQADLTRRYERLLRKVWQLRDKPGLSAAIYTQITDVESECNGLFTYDRKVLKVDPERIRNANQGNVGPEPKQTPVVPTALEEPIRWRYTVSPPAGEWNQPAFDDSAWQEGTAGFGTEGTPGAKIGTEWKTKDIWLRRKIQLPATKRDHWQLLVHHDEDVEIFINGVLAGKATGYGTEYDLLELTEEGRKALKPGENTLAVHCKQTGGGQYIDVGLVELSE
ncbi:MAG: glycoside hydrolase family 2 TIM barrel-domain containing protein [Planctomycetota bacterium]